MKGQSLIKIAVLLLVITTQTAATLEWEELDPSPPKNPKIERCLNNCETSETGVAFIQLWEGYSPFPYADVAGYQTVGYGHLILKGERFDGPLLPPQAYQLLRADLRPKEKAINRLVSVPLELSRFDAISSFTFNLGTGALSKSTLLKRVNQQRHVDVVLEFNKWIFAGGKKVKGLVLRRRAEGAMYLGA